MRRIFATGSLMLTLFAVSALSLRADEKKEPQTAAPSAEAQQAAFEAFIKPGKEHEQFKRLVGQWNGAVVSYYETPDAPSKSEAKATFRLLMGGRYLQQQFAGSFGDQKFTGMGLTGFDNAKKKFVSTWIDNMGTGIMMMEGTYDPKTNTMVEIGESSSPMGPMKMKAVTNYASNDKFVFTMYLLLPDMEQKVMEITYTRAKDKEKGKE
jgi:hypothetical protein